MPAILGRAAAQAGDCDSLPLRGGEILPDPDFSLLRSKDPYLIGIRPHREAGVRLELEQEPIASRWGPKFLIHNYGHGGAGITLSFGCASVVADHVHTLLRDVGRRRRVSVAVIGSGVIGLTVASELRRRWPWSRITVYAKELDVRRTTSFRAAGQFEPSGIYEEYETDVFDSNRGADSSPRGTPMASGDGHTPRGRLLELHPAINVPEFSSWL